MTSEPAPLGTEHGRKQLLDRYLDTLIHNVAPFWLQHGIDREHGGLLSALGRGGELLDSDKAIWIQGRAAWMFATLHRTLPPQPEWLAAAVSCQSFLRQHGQREDGKYWFTVTREGQPLRMRRYVYSEAFAAMAHAAMFAITGDTEDRDAACAAFETFVSWSFKEGVMPAKVEPATRPMQALGPHMIAIGVAQELRALIGDVTIGGRKCTGWIDASLATIENDFWHPEHAALLEVCGPNGEVLDHFDGRTLNPGHALECAWFVLHESRLRNSKEMQTLGLSILDAMWQRGWDAEHGGLFYFRDLRGLPVQEYWHDMKFWWPHNEAEIATLLAYRLTNEPRYAEWHHQVHEWSFDHFADSEHPEWFGYLHRDGRISSDLKGNHWKGPFHLPRMLWYCARELEQWSTTS
ncbi:MAG: AGE family epimerase/isomerase [Planctomycetota bacterium]|nr:AGE family epimerase/isomerase [Planctomycetota bacterium]